MIDNQSQNVNLDFARNPPEHLFLGATCAGSIRRGLGLLKQNPTQRLRLVTVAAEPANWLVALRKRRLETENWLSLNIRTYSGCATRIPELVKLLNMQVNQAKMLYSDV